MHTWFPLQRCLVAVEHVWCPWGRQHEAVEGRKKNGIDRFDLRKGIFNKSYTIYQTYVWFESDKYEKTHIELYSKRRLLNGRPISRMLCAQKKAFLHSATYLPHPKAPYTPLQVPKIPPLHIWRENMHTFSESGSVHQTMSELRRMTATRQPSLHSVQHTPQPGDSTIFPARFWTEVRTLHEAARYLQQECDSAKRAPLPYATADCQLACLGVTHEECDGEPHAEIKRRVDQACEEPGFPGASIPESAPELVHFGHTTETVTNGRRARYTIRVKIGYWSTHGLFKSWAQRPDRADWCAIGRGRIGTFCEIFAPSIYNRSSLPAFCARRTRYFPEFTHSGRVAVVRATDTNMLLRIGYEGADSETRQYLQTVGRPRSGCLLFRSIRLEEKTEAFVVISVWNSDSELLHFLNCAARYGRRSRLFFAISAIDKDDQSFSYCNCHAQTGMLREC